MIDITGFTPLPEDLQGWNSNNPIFKRLIDEVQPKTIIEVGSWKGASLVEMSKHTDAEFFCVDTWLGAVEFHGSMKGTKERDLMLKHGYPQVYYQWLSNVVHHNLQDRVTPITLPSSVAWQLLPKADLIYIDGSHEYADVMMDIINYSTLLNDGGILFGDDFANNAFPGVKSAVIAYAASVPNLKLEIIDDWYWVIRKLSVVKL